MRRGFIAPARPRVDLTDDRVELTLLVAHARAEVARSPESVRTIPSIADQSSRDSSNASRQRASAPSESPECCSWTTASSMRIAALSSGERAERASALAHSDTTS